MDFEIIQIPAGEADNFSYLVYCRATREGLAIDPSFKPEALLEAAREHDVTITVLGNTHGHRDHISGNGEILEATGAKLAAHPVALPQADIPLEEGSKLHIGNGTLMILHTPGHTPGSIIFKTNDAIITGDTLFVSRCGRADLPGSNVEDLYESLQRLKQLAPETRVYPGHNYGPQPVSTIGWELENNDFIRCPDLDSFVKLRMG